VNRLKAVTVELGCAQGRAAAGLILLGLHLGAWELADSIIMAEIPGTHAYVAALGVLGGIATFDNPLQVRSATMSSITEATALGSIRGTAILRPLVTDSCLKPSTVPAAEWLRMSVGWA
jgi:hypothetical protein